MTLENDWITIEIADTGIGIDNKALSGIFTFFSQENRSIACREGLGLGFPLAKGIIELHDGKIRANSEGLDRGTKLIIDLPVSDKKSIDADSIAEANDSKELIVIYNEEDEILNNGGRVLIIENEVDSASLMQTFLESLGYQTEIAFNGADGIALARQFSPDVILSDISLTAKMDGYTVASTIRNDPELNSIPLIAISGFGQPEDKERAKAAGFDAHLTKPLDINVLENAIAEKIA